MLLLAGVLAAPARAQIAAGPIAFAEAEIAAARAKHPEVLGGRVIFAIVPAGQPAADGRPLGTEGYAIEHRPEAGAFAVVAADERGAMYGGLDIAEAIAAGRSPSALAGPVHRPALAHRQVKVNLPLPGTGYVATETLVHNQWFWDETAWDAFLDLLVRSRYNALSLWGAHPYPQMVRLAKFPEVQDLPEADLARNLRLFHAIFGKARRRGLDVLLVTWNVHLSPSFAKAHGLPTAGADGPLVRDYQRECVRALLAEYPEITGIGTCAGEAMPQDARGREEFIRDTYIAGIAASGRRDVVFLHRHWQADPRLTEEIVARRSPAPVLVSIKFNGEHLYSSPTPHFVDRRWIDQEPRTYWVLWHLRNDDLFTLRWADPAFAGEVMRNVAQDGQGFLMGSEIWIDGEDWIHTEAARRHVTWRFDFERLWLRYAVWGRLGWDPATSDEVFVDQLAARVGEGAAGALFRALRSVSAFYPQLTAFHWNYMNGDWYPEGCVGNWVTGPEFGRGRNLRLPESIFHDVLEFIFNHTIDERLVSIPEMMAQVLAGWEPRAPARAPEPTKPGQQVRPGSGAGGPFPRRGTPLSVAQRIQSLAADAETALAGLDPQSASGELLCTLLDVRTQIALARYYAAKIEGAAHLGLHIAGISGEQELAVAALERARAAWDEAAAVGDAHYREHEIWLMGSFSWGRYRSAVAHDVEIARRCRADPEGCRRAMAFRLPFDATFDFNRLAGALDLGVPPFEVPAPVLVGAELVFLEAEDFAGPWRMQTNYPGYRGRGFRAAAIRGAVAATSLRRRIVLREPATVHFWVRGLLGHASDSRVERSVDLAVDGEALAPTQASIGGAPRWTWERAGPRRLAAGSHELEIRDHGPGYEHPDCVFLTIDPDLAPGLAEVSAGDPPGGQGR